MSFINLFLLLILNISLAQEPFLEIKPFQPPGFEDADFCKQRSAPKVRPYMIPVYTPSGPIGSIGSKSIGPIGQVAQCWKKQIGPIGSIGRLMG